MAFKRSAVRSRLSPPHSPEMIEFQGFCFGFYKDANMDSFCSMSHRTRSLLFPLICLPQDVSHHLQHRQIVQAAGEIRFPVYGRPFSVIAALPAFPPFLTIGWAKHSASSAHFFFPATRHPTLCTYFFLKESHILIFQICFVFYYISNVFFIFILFFCCFLL